MNVIQTDSFEILYLGYNVIMVSKGRWFDNCFGFFHFIFYFLIFIYFEFSLKKKV